MRFRNRALEFNIWLSQTDEPHPWLPRLFSGRSLPSRPCHRTCDRGGRTDPTVTRLTTVSLRGTHTLGDHHPVLVWGGTRPREERHRPCESDFSTGAAALPCSRCSPSDFALDPTIFPGRYADFLSPAYRTPHSYDNYTVNLPPSAPLRNYTVNLTSRRDWRTILMNVRPNPHRYRTDNPSTQGSTPPPDYVA